MKLWGSTRNIPRRSWKKIHLEIICPSMTFKRTKNQLRTDFGSPGKSYAKITKFLPILGNIILVTNPKFQVKNIFGSIVSDFSNIKTAFRSDRKIHLSLPTS